MVVVKIIETGKEIKVEMALATSTTCKAKGGKTYKINTPDAEVIIVEADFSNP
jgi:hypothetical protein